MNQILNATITTQRRNTERNIVRVVISAACRIVSGRDAALIVRYTQRMRIDMADCLAIYKAINLMFLSQANATSLTGAVTHTENTRSDRARVWSYY